MEISGKQSTKSYGTQLSVARKQQSHMIRGGKKSTKLYGTQWQENNKVIQYDSRRKVNEVI